MLPCTKLLTSTLLALTIIEISPLNNFTTHEKISLQDIQLVNVNTDILFTDTVSDIPLKFSLFSKPAILWQVPAPTVTPPDYTPPQGQQQDWPMPMPLPEHHERIRSDPIVSQPQPMRSDPIVSQPQPMRSDPIVSQPQPIHDQPQLLIEEVLFNKNVDDHEEDILNIFIQQPEQGDNLDIFATYLLDTVNTLTIGNPEIFINTLDGIPNTDEVIAQSLVVQFTVNDDSCSNGIDIDTLDILVD